MYDLDPAWLTGSKKPKVANVLAVNEQTLNTFHARLHSTTTLHHVANNNHVLPRESPDACVSACALPPLPRTPEITCVLHCPPAAIPQHQAHGLP